MRHVDSPVRGAWRGGRFGFQGGDGGAHARVDLAHAGCAARHAGKLLGARSALLGAPLHSKRPMRHQLHHAGLVISSRRMST